MIEAALFGVAYNTEVRGEKSSDAPSSGGWLGSRLMWKWGNDKRLSILDGDDSAFPRGARRLGGGLGNRDLRFGG